MSITTPAGHSERSIICIGRKETDPAAVRFAELVTRALGMELILLHVTRAKTANEQEAHILSTTLSYLSHEPDQVLQIPGDFKHVIFEELDPEAHELVVLGTSAKPSRPGSSRLSRVVAEKIADSVLFIRNPPDQVKRVLICTGGHAASNTVLERGLALASCCGAEATILHVVSSSPSMYTGLKALDESLADILQRETPLAQHLREAAARAEEAGIQASLELRHGVVVEEILRAAELGNYDLIVIGAPEPRRLLTRLALGRIGPQLLTSAQASVFIARTYPHPSAFE
jgi:nucleotide-binding universal stress UspA family protein